MSTISFLVITLCSGIHAKKFYFLIGLQVKLCDDSFSRFRVREGTTVPQSIRSVPRHKFKAS